MKLNLLPAKVVGQTKSRTAWIISSLMMLAGIGGAIAMVMISRSQLIEVKQQVADKRSEADAAYQISAQADTIIAKAEGVIRNTNLANAMLAHNTVYPDLYQKLMAANPPFFRWTSIQATPVDDKTAQVTIQGTITTYQQYADLMLALMRNPLITAVGRSGFVSTDEFVPNLVPTDQKGKAHKPGETAIPDDPLERLAYFQAQSQPSGYEGVGGFGSGQEGLRTAKPGDSLIQVTLTVKANLQVPNPRSTLQAGGGAAAAAGGGAAGASVPGPAGASVPGPGGFGPGGAPGPAGGGRGPLKGD